MALKDRLMTPEDEQTAMHRLRYIAVEVEAQDLSFEVWPVIASASQPAVALEALQILAANALAGLAVRLEVENGGPLTAAQIEAIATAFRDNILCGFPQVLDKVRRGYEPKGQ